MSDEIDQRMVRVWVAFADQFLDTETRHDLPFAALSAVEAGLTVAQARDVWRAEVEPVVGMNLLAVAGEWALWDREWLLARIAAVRRRTGPLAWLGRKLPGLGHGTWRAVAGCMELLLAAPKDRRAALAHDLHALARHYFGFCPRAFGLSAPGRREALERLFREDFLPIFSRVVHPAAGESRAAYRERVEAALARGSA